MPPNLANLPVPDQVKRRFWDFIVQSIADAFERRHRPDIAVRIEKLRATPNLQRLISTSVQTGWVYWLEPGHSHWPKIVQAVLDDVQNHLPTLKAIEIRELFNAPLRRQEIEAYLAEWFHGLGSGATYKECQSAAHELTDAIFHAALGSAPLRDLVQAVIEWDDSHQHPMPDDGPRLKAVRDLAKAVAKEARYPDVTSAHLFIALSSFSPAGRVQTALHTAGATPPAITAASTEVLYSAEPLRDGLSPEETRSVHSLIHEARCIAREENSREVSDLHLLRGMLALAADIECEAGETLRRLFKALSLDIRRCAAELESHGTWGTLAHDPGVLLSFRNW